MKMSIEGNDRHSTVDASSTHDPLFIAVELNLLANLGLLIPG